MLAGMTTETPLLYIEMPYGDPELGLTRQMRVNNLSAEQITVWQANGERFAELNREWGDADRVIAQLGPDHPQAKALRERRATQAARGLGRAMSVLRSVLADETDRDWLEDQLTFGGMTLEGDRGAASLISRTIDAYRAQTPAKAAAAPAKKTGKAKLAE